MFQQDLCIDQGRVLLVCKIRERLINHQTDPARPAPSAQSEHFGFGKIIAARIVRIRKDKAPDPFPFKEKHEVFCSKGKIRILRDKKRRIRGTAAVGILLKSRPDKACLSGKICHQAPDQFTCAVPDEDGLLRDAEILCCQEPVYPHSARIGGEKLIRYRLHLILHFLRREIRVDKVAEIQQKRIPPVTAVTVCHQLDLFLL